MTTLNFKEEFAGAVARGEKVQTIRRVREVHIKVGDTLQLFTGQRQIGVGVVKAIMPIEIHTDGIVLDGRAITIAEEDMGHALNLFAVKDGFKHFLDMSLWFNAQYGLPFSGVAIRWELEGGGKDE